MADKAKKGKSSAKEVPTKKVFDFSNVKEQSQFSPKRKKSGDYEAVIASYAASLSNASNPQWVYAIQLTSDKGATYGYYCQFEEKHLWKLRNLMVAAGLNVPKKKVSVDGSKLVGKLIGVQLEDDEYEGREKSMITRVFPTSELADAEPVEEDDDDEDEEEDDEVDTDSDDDESDDDDEDEDDDDSDEEDDSDDEDDEDDSDDDEEEEDEDDEEEEEEEKPAPKKSKKAAPAKAAAKSSKKPAKPEPKKASKKAEKVPAKKAAGKKRKSIDIDDL